MERAPYVYILARASHSTFYTGVTSSLVQRIYQHRNDYFRGFTERYGIKRRFWFERHATMDDAILREKQIKRWYDLINAMNPKWRDLAEDFGFPPLPARKADPGSSPGCATNWPSAAGTMARSGDVDHLPPELVAPMCLTEIIAYAVRKKGARTTV